MNNTTQDKILCCDWGTSNFRLYLVALSSATVIKEHSTNKGISDINQAFQAQDRRDRISFFGDYLHEQILWLTDDIEEDVSVIPVILSGMASSSIGMVEVQYDSLPFSLHQPALNHHSLQGAGNSKNKLYIFGGLCTDADVMRGEEVEILGITDIIDASNCMCILPGTHAKHIHILDGAIVGFETYMTGEVFNLMSNHSILQHSVEAPSVSASNGEEEFRRGVIEGAEENLLHTLFKIRTNDILHQIRPHENYLYLSGQLIGHELKSLRSFQGQIYIAGGGRLAPFYKLAIDALGLSDRTIIVQEEQMGAVIPIAHVSLFNSL